MKGLIIAAGYGTRFLPVTKTIPKEMLPLVDKPAIAFIVEEFLASGITEIVVISSRRKKALEDFFDREIELETVLEQNGAKEKLEKIRPYDARFVFIRQLEMRGTGHAILQARSLVGDEPFVVAYPDDLHFGEIPLTRQLVDAYEKTGCSVLASIHDPPDINRYGVLALSADGEHVSGIIEKPARGKEPSKEASIGRYLYAPDFMPLLEEGWSRHRRGEYYHTYALGRLMETGRVVHRRVEGARFDTGSPEGYLEAIVHYAAKQPAYAAVLREALKALGKPHGN